MREITYYHIQYLFQKENYLSLDRKIENPKKNFEQILEEEINRSKL